MRKILFLLLLISGIASAQNVPGYTLINSRYVYLGTAHNDILMPAGSTAVRGTGTWDRSGALYYDSTGADTGLYVYHRPYWVKVGSSKSFANGLYDSSGIVGWGAGVANKATYDSWRYVNTRGMREYRTSGANSMLLWVDSLLAGGGAFITLKGIYGGAFNFESDGPDRSFNGISWYKKGLFRGTIGHDVDSAGNTNHLFFDDSHDANGWRSYNFEFSGTSSMVLYNTGVTYMANSGAKRLVVGNALLSPGQTTGIGGSLLVTDSVLFTRRIASSTSNDSVVVITSTGLLKHTSQADVASAYSPGLQGVITQNPQLSLGFYNNIDVNSGTLQIGASAGSFAGMGIAISPANDRVSILGATGNARFDAGTQASGNVLIQNNNSVGVKIWGTADSITIGALASNYTKTRIKLTNDSAFIKNLSSIGAQAQSNVVVIDSITGQLRMMPKGAIGGTGTVTSVATGLGLSGGPITTSGTIIADTTYLLNKSTQQVISANKIFTTAPNFTTLTANQVMYAGASGAVTGAAALTWDGNIFKVKAGSSGISSIRSEYWNASTIYIEMATDASGNGRINSQGVDLAFQRSGTNVMNMSVNTFSVLSGINMNVDANTLYVHATNNGVGFGTATPTSKAEFAAGSTTANTAPIEFNSGATETTIRSGLLQYNDQFYLSNVALNQVGMGGPIADFSTDVSNGTTVETDLYTYTTKVNTLNATGERVIADYTVSLTDATADKVLKVYFAGTQIFTSGTLTSGVGTVRISVSVMRTGASTARAVVSGISPLLGAPITETDLTGLTFSGTNIIKITGQASGASGGSGDITAKIGGVFFWPASNN